MSKNHIRGSRNKRKIPNGANAMADQDWAETLTATNIADETDFLMDELYSLDVDQIFQQQQQQQQQDTIEEEKAQQDFNIGCSNLRLCDNESGYEDSTSNNSSSSVETSNNDDSIRICPNQFTAVDDGSATSYDRISVLSMDLIASAQKLNQARRKLHEIKEMQLLEIEQAHQIKMKILNSVERVVIESLPNLIDLNSLSSYLEDIITGTIVNVDPANLQT